MPRVVEALHAGGRVGQPLEFEFDDVLSGERVTLDSYAGRPLLLCSMLSSYHMDAIELGPVRELAAWQRKASASTQVIGSWNSPTTDAAPTKRATAEHGIEWRVFQDSAPRAEVSWTSGLKVPVMPLFLLLDREGRLERVSMRVATLFE